MSEGQKPAPTFWERVGRVAGRVVAFLAGTGMTVFAVLTVAGVVVWQNGAGQPVHNIFVRILLGLIYGFWGLGTVGGAIFGFPDVSHDRRPGARRASGGIGFGGDID